MTLDLERELRDYGAAPEHMPEFESGLRAALRAERLRRRAGHVGEDGVSVPAAGRRHLGRWALLAAALAALVATVAIVGTNAARELGRPAPASAAEVVARARQSMMSHETVSATIVHASAQLVAPDVRDLKEDWTSADWFALAHVRGPAVPYSDPARMIITGDGRSRLVSPLTRAAFQATTGPAGSNVVVRTLPRRLQLTRDVPAEAVRTSDDRLGVQSWYQPGYSYEGEGESGTSPERAHVTTGTAPGAPDATGSISSWLDVSTLSILANGSAIATTYDGRPAFVVSADVTPGPVVRGTETHIVDGVETSWPTYALYRELDRIEVTIDRDTWFPVRRTMFFHGEIVDDVRLTDLRFDDSVAGGQFEPAFPDGVKAAVSNDGFRRVTVQAAVGAFGYQPLAPRTLPAGFAFSYAAVASSSRFTAVRPDSALGHVRSVVSRDITAIRYRAGFLAFTVTTRREKGMRPADGAYPFVADPSQAAAPDERSTETVPSGALRGVRLRVEMPLLGTPHLWAYHDGLMVTIAGDLTREQLIEVARSLAPLQ